MPDSQITLTAAMNSKAGETDVSSFSQMGDQIGGVIAPRIVKNISDSIINMDWAALLAPLAKTLSSVINSGLTAPTGSGAPSGPNASFGKQDLGGGNTDDFGRKATPPVHQSTFRYVGRFDPSSTIESTEAKRITSDGAAKPPQSSDIDIDMSGRAARSSALGSDITGLQASYGNITARMVKAQRRAGFGEMTEEQESVIKTGYEASRARSAAIDKELDTNDTASAMGKFKESIETLTASINKAGITIEEKEQKQKEHSAKTIEMTEFAAERVKEKARILEDAAESSALLGEGAAQRQSRRQATAAAVGGALAFAGHIPSMLIQNEAAGKRLATAGVRAAMAGDTETLLSQGYLGGEEEIKRRASNNAMMSVGGELAGAAVTGLLSVKNPFLAPVALGLGMKAGGDIINWSGTQEKAYQEIQSADITGNKVRYDVARSGMATHIEARDRALAMGSPMAEGYLSGGMISAAEAKRPRRPSNIIGGGDDLSQLGSFSLDEMERLGMTAATGDIAGVANKYNWSQDQLKNFLAKTAQVGGMETETGIAAVGMTGGLKSLATAETAGLTNATDIYGQMVLGSGMSRSAAAQIPERLMDTALAAGMSPTQIPGALAQVGQESQRLGTGELAINRFDAAMAASKGGIPAEQTWARTAYANVEKSGKESGGLGRVMEMRAMEDLQRKAKKTFTPAQQERLMQYGVDETTLKEFGVTTKAKELAAGYPEMRMKAARQVDKDVRGEGLVLGRLTGAVSNEEIRRAQTGFAKDPRGFTPTTTQKVADEAATTAGAKAMEALNKVKFAEIAQGLKVFGDNLIILNGQVESVNARMKKASEPHLQGQGSR